jgi:hypothetical protein
MIIERGNTMIRSENIISVHISTIQNDKGFRVKYHFILAHTGWFTEQYAESDLYPWPQFDHIDLTRGSYHIDGIKITIVRDKLADEIAKIKSDML